MPKSFSILLAAALTFCTALTLAQETPPTHSPLAMPVPAAEKKSAEIAVNAPSTAGQRAPARDAATSAATATPAPVETAVTPTPKPRKPSFFQRLFGKRKPRATPTPAPAATPSASPTPRRSPRKPTPTPAADATPKPAKKPDTATPAPKISRPAATPAPDVTAPAATPKKAAPAKASAQPAATPARQAPVEPPADADPEAKEKFRFESARNKALDDPQLLSLKAKADNATTDDESRKTMRAYNQALFDKIRKLDSSVKDRADRLEAAILKRLGE